MLLIDTSVWISVFRDRSGQVRQQLEILTANQEVLLTRFTQLELLQGSLTAPQPKGAGILGSSGDAPPFGIPCDCGRKGGWTQS